MSHGLGAPLPLAGEVAARSDAGEGFLLSGSPTAETTLSPALPRKRGRERSSFVAGIADLTALIATIHHA